ncbi:MAG: hypothetical protein ABIP64_07100, partial [Burkholderiales bacterium]
TLALGNPDVVAFCSTTTQEYSTAPTQWRAPNRRPAADNGYCVLLINLRILLVHWERLFIVERCATSHTESGSPASMPGEAHQY